MIDPVCLSVHFSRDFKERYPDVVGEIFHHLEPHLASDSVESFSQHLPSVNLKHDMVRSDVESKRTEKQLVPLAIEMASHNNAHNT